MDASSQPDAVADGRRIYLGNLQYEVEPTEIEDVLVAAGFGNFKQIHLSIDPVNGRNPGYCFVDFADREAAEKALSSLDASIRDRPLKVGPCRPKQSSRPADLWGRDGRDGRDSRDSRDNSRWGRDNRDGDRSAPSPSQRWGDWRRSDSGAEPNRPRRDGTGPAAALNHNDQVTNQQIGTRLYFGGLGKVASQDENHEEMSELLAGFNPTTIGKRVTAHNDAPPKPGNHNYCFVDFETSKEATEVLKALNGTPYQDGFLRVAAAKERTERTERTDRADRTDDQRKSNYRRNNETADGDAPSPRGWGRDSGRDAGRDATPSKPKAFESGNWRR